MIRKFALALGAGTLIAASPAAFALDGASVKLGRGDERISASAGATSSLRSVRTSRSYLEHSASSVRLYLQESFTVRVLAPEAAVPLSYAKQ